jgi:hypothetical protein
MKRLLALFHDRSGQAMVEYVIVTSATALVTLAFLQSDVFDILPAGIYRSIYLLMRGLIINAALPIP